GREAPSLGLEIRYALVRASVDSITDNLPDGLLEGLVANEVWAAGRALAAARGWPTRTADARRSPRSTGTFRPSYGPRSSPRRWPRPLPSRTSGCTLAPRPSPAWRPTLP